MLAMNRITVADVIAWETLPPETRERFQALAVEQAITDGYVVDTDEVDDLKSENIDLEAKLDERDREIEALRDVLEEIQHALSTAP